MCRSERLVFASGDVARVAASMLFTDGFAFDDCARLRKKRHAGKRARTDTRTRHPFFVLAIFAHTHTHTNTPTKPHTHTHTHTHTDTHIRCN